MTKKKDNVSGQKVIGLKQPPSKSPDHIMSILREAITHARHNKMRSAFIVLVPERGDKDEAMTKIAVPLNNTDIDILLQELEEGHEIVYQLGRGEQV